MPLGKLINGLYYTKDKAHDISSKAHPLANVVNSKNMMEHAKLWHTRLGHAPFPKFKILFLEIDTKSIKDSFLCTICPQSRQNRLPFYDSYIKTNHAFDLLHIDT